jgi:hypothetical protein
MRLSTKFVDKSVHHFHAPCAIADYTSLGLRLDKKTPISNNPLKTISCLWNMDGVSVLKRFHMLGFAGECTVVYNLEPKSDDRLSDGEKISTLSSGFCIAE